MDLGRFERCANFDDAITAPSCGFKDAQAYYESAARGRSSADSCAVFIDNGAGRSIVPYEAHSRVRRGAESGRFGLLRQSVAGIADLSREHGGA